MGLLQLRRAVTEKLQRPNPGIFSNIFLFWSLKEKIVMEGLQATKSRQVTKLDHYVLCITCTLNQGHPIPGFLTLAACYFWEHTVNSSPSMHWYLPFPWSRVSLSSSHSIHCNTPHLVPKIILIAWTSKHEFSTFLLSPRIIFRDSFYLGRYNLVSILTQYSILVLKTWWATHKNPEGTLHLLSAATLN